MDVDAFIARHPRLYHMAEAGSWPQIERGGLLSTSALLDRFGYEGEERFVRWKVGRSTHFSSPH